MINDFVSFRQAEELSNLGFNYRCFASYGYKSKAISISMDGHDKGCRPNLCLCIRLDA